MRVFLFVCSAQNKDAFEKLVRKFGFDDERYKTGECEHLVIKLKVKIDAIKKGMESNGEIIITRESTARQGRSRKITGGQGTNSKASDGQ